MKRKTDDKTPFRSTVAYQAMLLGVSAMIATTVLSFGNLATKDVIALRVEEDLKASLSQVVSPELYDEDLLRNTLEMTDPNGDDLVVYQAARDGTVTAVIFEVGRNGYSGVIRSIVAVDPDGIVLGVRVLAHTETPGLGDKIEVEKDDWILGFNGLSLENPPRSSWAVKKDGGHFDQFTGATITPRAVVRSIREGLEFFEGNKEQMLVFAGTGRPEGSSSGAIDEAGRGAVESNESTGTNQ